MTDRNRLRILRVTLAHPHRYRWYRAATMGVTLAVLFAVPIAGLARFDVWGGGHLALGRPVDPARGLAAVLAAIAAFYVVTFLVNIPAGRLFCGFGCPVGQLSRLADAIDAFPADAARRRRAWLALVGFASALALATLLWWVSPAVVVDGTSAARSAAFGILLLVAGYAVLHGRRFRWGFCRKLCPIGLYYSAVQTPVVTRVDFDPHATCTGCDACAGICPAGLDPRRLDQPVPSPGGLAFADLPAAAHCLHCGACVEICEIMTRKHPGVPAMAFRRPTAARDGDVARDAAA